MEEQTTINFYKSIKKEEDKYRLVNRLFIVKYISEDISIYIGSFDKARSALNESKISKIRFDAPRDIVLKYNKKEHTHTTTLGFWKPLQISFTEEPIRSILCL